MTRVKSIIAILALTLLLALGLWFYGHGLRNPETATINWNDVRQTVDGFGGSSADFIDALTPAQADFFFTRDGIGLSILRTQIIPDLATCNAEFHDGGCSDSNGQVLNGELTTAQLAVARGAIVISTPWSPPGAYKSNGSFKNGGYLLPSFYSEWAGKIATYVSMMRSHGVPIYAVSVQNEPNLTTGYGSCIYTAQDIHDFVPFLHSALRSVGAESTKIMIAEESKWAIDLTSIAMSDANVASQVGIIAAHGYGDKLQAFHTGSARLWQTEDSNSLSSIYDGGITEGMVWARKIHRYLTEANVNAWLWWFLTNMPRQGEGKDNSALTDINGNYPKRAFVIGQWGKFVRPGWSRVEASYSSPLQITAFKDPGDHSFAIVVVNSSTHPVHQTITFSGFSTSSVTPWITSETMSLAQQAPVSVGGKHFSYTVPALSVITFSGTSLTKQ